MLSIGLSGCCRAHCETNTGLLSIEVSENKTRDQHDTNRATQCENECIYDLSEGPELVELLLTQFLPPHLQSIDILLGEPQDAAGRAKLHWAIRGNILRRD